MKAWWRRVRPRILPPVIYFIIKLLGDTYRLKVEGWEKVEVVKTGKILCAFHGRTVMATKLFRNRNYWALISHSRDGEMQNGIFRRFGFQTIRGSTGRGGLKAALEAIKVLRNGDTLVFTPDGPRGPSGIVQEGAMMIARKSGAALIPVGVSAKRRKLFRSWDRFMIPKPFSQCVMLFGDPIYIPEDASEEEVEKLRLEFQTAMREIEAEAIKKFGHPPADWHSPAETSPKPLK